MLRSIGRALGEVAVEGGAEKVCEPRLPKLKPRPARASAWPTASAIAATTAKTARSGRQRKRNMVFPPTGGNELSAYHIGMPRGDFKGCRAVSRRAFALSVFAVRAGLRERQRAIGEAVVLLVGAQAL